MFGICTLTGSRVSRNLSALYRFVGGDISFWWYFTHVIQTNRLINYLAKYQYNLINSCPFLISISLITIPDDISLPGEIIRRIADFLV